MMRQGDDEQHYTVVVGIDGSPFGQRALTWALNEARARRGRVRAVHAWMMPYSWQLEVSYPLDEEHLRDAAQRQLDESVSEVDTSGVALDAELVEGDPRQVLIDAAQNADLLVVGSHGRGLVAQLLLGSVSTFCVHHARTTPVVVVHAADRPDRGSEAGAGSTVMARPQTLPQWSS